MKKIITLLLAALPLMVAAQDAAKLEKKAAAGDTKAMVELAACYEAGHGVAVDSARALELYRKAADAGNADAKAGLSYYYLWYSGLPRDEKKALQLAQESATAGSGRGMARLAVCYQDAIGVPRNYAKAIALLEQGAAKGAQSALAMLAWGYLYGDDSIDYDPQRAYAYIKKLPDGCASSKYIAMATYNALVKNDPKTAYAWLQKGIATDNQRAAMNAVRSRFYGWGCDEDEQAAMKDLEALKAKYGADNFDLMMLEFEFRASANDSTLRDKEKAKELLLKVGDVPFYTNYNELGASYVFGNITEVDTVKAAYYWLKGAAKDDTKSMTQLAILKLNQGQLDSAKYFAQMAYERQDDDICRFLAHCAMYGKLDGKEDLQLAKAYFIESARRGNRADLVEAGKICLWTGDTTEAFRHFDRAIALGHTDAYENKAYTYIENGDRKTGIALLKKGAMAGSMECMVSLGDEAAEDEQYQKAAGYYAQADNGEGCFKLGRLYLYGALAGDSAANVAKGVSLMRRSMAYGNQDAMMLMAECYKIGYGVDERPDSARIVYENLAKNGHEGAMLKLVTYYAEMGDTVAAVEALQQGVYKGSQMAMLALGEKYIEGVGVPADTVHGVSLYYLAAEMDPDNIGVQIAFAEIYLEGLEGKKDTVEAIPYLRKAAELGSGWAQAQMGDMYYYGYGGLEKSFDSAMFFYYDASKQDNPRGDYMMGKYHDNRGNNSAAMSYYFSAARNGNRDAYVEVARAMQSGNGIDADPSAAYQMATKAATEWGLPEAYMLLGFAHLNGLGCEVDSTLAFQYTLQAAEGGSPRGMLNLATMYDNAMGTERDTVQMLNWYNRAVAKGSTRAMLTLASRYAEGVSVPQDDKRAAELYQLAADNGSNEGLCRLGLCYEEGKGVTLNSRKAFNLYNKAADNGSAWGMRLVAYCYAQGIYVKEDEEQAAQWFLKSAEAGDLQSCYITGMLYANGQGFKKNKKEAKKWLKLAAEHGHEGAAEALESL